MIRTPGRLEFRLRASESLPLAWRTLWGGAMTVDDGQSHITPQTSPEADREPLGEDSFDSVIHAVDHCSECSHENRNQKPNHTTEEKADQLLSGGIHRAGHFPCCLRLDCWMRLRFISFFPLLSQTISKRTPSVLRARRVLPIRSR